MALRHQHALAPAGRAAHEVRVRDGPAVVLREDLLREHGHAPDRLVGEVEARLLLRHEGRVEDLPAVAGVGGDDGEAAGERGVALPRPAERRRHGAVQAAPALEQEASVPLGGKRQREPDAVAPAVRAGAPVERRAQPAVGRAAARRAEPPTAAPAAAASRPRTTPPVPPTARRPAPAAAGGPRTRTRRAPPAPGPPGRRARPRVRRSPHHGSTGKRMSPPIQPQRRSAHWPLAGSSLRNRAALLYRMSRFCSGVR